MTDSTQPLHAAPAEPVAVVAQLGSDAHYDWSRNRWDALALRADEKTRT